MELIRPSVAYRDSFIEAVKEFQADHSFPLQARDYDALSIAELESDFETYVEKKKSESRGENLPQGYVPATTFWLVDNGEFIGVVNIRHTLSESLEKWFGHIGYNIRPSKRKMKYGTHALAFALPKARELGVNRILITCDETNVASRKIIEKNGGVFENAQPNPATGVDKLRFWI
jgi:predicted acetyltransferase